MKKELTLLIIQKDNKILLGIKKRGFGMGKWNGFGGKVEKDETIEDGARRELFEEAGISVNSIEKIGVLNFIWEHKKEEALEVNIFKATDFVGEPQETEEMKPQWFSITEIPFEKMWADDKYWMQLFLNNKKFEGKFIFDEHNHIIEHELHQQL